MHQPKDKAEPVSPMLSPAPIMEGYPASGKDIISMLSGYFIKQKVICKCTCSLIKSFDVFYKTAYKNFSNAQSVLDYSKGKLFKCKSVISCGKAWSYPDCREVSYNVFVYLFINGQKVKQPFLRLDKDPKCQCWCCKAPYFKVYYTENGSNELIGFAKMPFTCCGITGSVHSSESLEEPKYTIDGSCAQCGLFFKMPCKPCQEIIFNIYDSNHKEQGVVKKTYAGCGKELLNVDNYLVEFGLNMPWKYKCIFIAYVLLLDMMIFEDNGNKNNGLFGLFTR